MYNTLKKINFLISKSQKINLIVLTILLFFGMILEFFGLGILVPVINILIDPSAFTQNQYFESLREFFTGISDQSFILYLLGFIVVFYVAKSCFLVLLAFKQNRFLSFLNASISNKLFSSYMNQPYDYHLKINSSDLVKNLQIEAGHLFTFITSLINIFIEGGLILAVFITLIIIEPLGTLILSTFFLTLTIIFYKLTKSKLDIWGRTRQELDLNSAKTVTEGLGAIRDLIISGKINFFTKKYNDLSFKKARITSNHILFGQLPRFYFELASISGLVLFIFILIISGKSTTVLIATLGVFVAGVFRVLPSLNRVITSLQNLKFYKSSVDIIYHELNSFNSNAENKKIDQRLKFKNKIFLKNITFNYGKKIILKNTSLEILKNEFVGIIGESGAGKSTLVDLIVGLQTPNYGEILIDDKSLFNISSEWMPKIGYISQNIFLIDDTIESNIAFGVPKDQISVNRLNEVISQVQLHNFITELPNRLQTKVGERGVQISGGQKQRIGIARALYHNPEILVLDEATSALDPDTEKSIFNLMEFFKSHKTIIIISHNISNLDFCDKVYKIENKKIINHQK